MSIVQIESGGSSATAAKAFTSFSVGLLLYGNSLYEFITTDIQIMIFWAGLLFLTLTILPLYYGFLKLFVHLKYDRKLVEKSFSFWNTLNQPVWEKFLNDITRDLYLSSAFILIFIKFYINPNLFTEELTHLFELSNIIFPFISLFLLIVVVLRLLYNIYQNEFDIKITQYYLTRIENSARTGEILDNYYINKATPLFKSEIIKLLKNFAIGLPFRYNQYQNYSNLTPDNLKFFNSIRGDVSPLLTSFNNKLIHFLPVLKTNVSMSLLNDLEKTLSLIDQAFRPLVKRLNGGEGLAFKLLGNPNSKETDYSMWTHRKHIEDALHDINIPKEDINQETIESIYINLANLSISLKELETTLKEFISSGEKERNLTEFLKQPLTKLIGLKKKIIGN